MTESTAQQEELPRPPLLPCPFCGSPPHIEMGLVHGDSYSCSSDRCFMMTIGLPLEAWNTRHRPRVSLSELASVMQNARNPKAMHQGREITQAILTKLKKDGVVFDVES